MTAAITLLMVFVAGQSEPPIDPATLEAQLPFTSGTARLDLLTRLAEGLVEREPTRATPYAEEAEALARQLSVPGGAARACLVAARALTLQGKSREALPVAERCLALAAPGHDDAATAAAAHALGNVYFYLDRYADAGSAYQRAYDLRERSGDRAGLAKSALNLGNIYCHLSETDRCETFYRRALTLMREVGDRGNEANALNNLGLVAMGRGHLDEATDLYLQALGIDEQQSNERGIERSASNLCTVFRRTGDLAQARRNCERALAACRALGDQRCLADALSNLGAVFVAEGDDEEALKADREALDLSERAGNRRGATTALRDIAGLLRRRGQLAEAEAHLRRALTVAEATGLDPEIGETLMALGGLATARGDFGEAQRDLERALVAGGKSNEKGLVRDIHLALAELWSASGDYRKAFEAYKRYVEVKDLILKQDTAARVAEIEKRFDTEKKEKEIVVLEGDKSRLQQTNEIQRLGLERERLWRVILVGGIAAVMGLLGLLFRRYLYLLAFWRRSTYVGHYRLVAQIGAGGMGVVWRAVDRDDPSRLVALKLLREEYCGDDALRRRFKNEAALIDQLHHPNIVRVFERGEHQGRLFTAMELLEGTSIADLIRRGRRLPLGFCLSVAAQLADALAKIHEKSIVHRDVKPENVIVLGGPDDEPRVRLLDFGIAHSASLTNLTETGVILGTLHYLAPEQISSHESSAASDVYSLGAVFYELVTLEKPFLGLQPIDVLKQILGTEPVGPRALRADLPPEIDALVLEMLHKRPEERPTDEEVRRRLALGRAALPTEVARDGDEQKVVVS